MHRVDKPRPLRNQLLCTFYIILLYYYTPRINGLVRLASIRLGFGYDRYVDTRRKNGSFYSNRVDGRTVAIRFVPENLGFETFCALIIIVRRLHSNFYLLPKIGHSSIVVKAETVVLRIVRKNKLFSISSPK